MPAGARRGRAARAPGRLDWRGLLLLSPGVALVVFGLSEVATARLGDPRAAAAGARRHRCSSSPSCCAPGARRRRSSTCGCSAAAASPRPRRPSSSSAPRCSARCSCCRSTTRSRAASSPLEAGLLMAPQGLGAALGMNRAGRLTDRVGGGPVVVAGLLVLHARHGRRSPRSAPDTSYWLLGVALVAAGHRPGLHDDAGDGRGLRDARALPGAARDADAQRAAARRRLDRARRCWRSCCSTSSAHAGGLAGAGARRGRPRDRFAHTYWWAMAMTAVALIPALVLAHAQRRPARAQRGRDAGVAPEPTSRTRPLRRGGRVLLLLGVVLRRDFAERAGPRQPARRRRGAPYRRGRPPDERALAGRHLAPRSRRA